jgi:chaperone modulatory protein CbpM
MSAQDATVYTGTLVEDHEVFSLDDLTRFCAVERRRVVELVEEGVIEAQAVTVTVTELRFSGTALRRARLALRLQRDLGINAAGTALVLDLLERIQSLEQRLGPR